MPSAAWIAAIVGLGGGLVLALVVAQAVVPRWVEKSENMALAIRLALGGTVVALFPALLLSLLAGAAFGSVWGECVFDRLGFPAGAPIGLALGVALVFALVLVAGAGLGILLANAWLRYRKSQSRS